MSDTSTATTKEQHGIHLLTFPVKSLTSGPSVTSPTSRIVGVQKDILGGLLLLRENIGSTATAARDKELLRRTASASLAVY